MKFIVLYGRSGSGKTTIAKEISSVLSSKRISNSILSLDSFYKESYEGSFDEPDAFHWERLEFVIQQLLKHKTVYL
jgi:uridine kinase